MGIILLTYFNINAHTHKQVSIYLSIYQVDDLSRGGDPKAPFSIATTPRYREVATPFPYCSTLLLILTL